ncbi:MAG: cyclic nucleotide-binding domain-containing protein [Pseudomonadota bacterium]
MAASSYASSLSALASSVEVLLQCPTELDALALVAERLEELAVANEAIEAYRSLGKAALVDGRPALGIAAAKALGKLGASAFAEESVAALAKTYASAATSPADRIPPGLRPPAPPKSVKRQDAGGAATDTRAVVAQASKAIAQVAARADAAVAGGATAKVPLVPLLGETDVPGFVKLAGKMQLVRLHAGEVVCEVGDAAEKLYLVARGTLRVDRNGQELGKLRPEAFFGEIALLLAGIRRTARVSCIDDVWLLEVSRAALEEAATQSPGIAGTLARFARNRLLANTLRTSDVFKRLPATSREQLVRTFVPKMFEANATIVCQGEIAGCLHVLVSGDVEVRKDGKRVAALTTGDVFGEMSLLGRRPATADVKTLTPVVTLSLDRDAFSSVAVEHPALLAEVYRISNERMEEEHVVTDEDIVVV